MARHLAAISHTVDLQAYVNWVTGRMVALLDSVEAELAAIIEEGLSGLLSEYSLDRLTSLLVSVRMLNAETYANISSEYAADMRAMVTSEIEFYTRLVGAPEVGVVIAEQVYAAATESPIQGRLLKSLFSSMEETRALRIQQQIAQGYVEGRTMQEITRSIFGSELEAGTLDMDRRSLQNVVRTATQHYAAEARDEVYHQNADIVKSIVWIATLDTRTSDICRIRDGTRWTIDGAPIGHNLEWLDGPGEAHWNCRSTAYPEVDVPGLDLSRGRSRASMDGPVPATMTFADWIKRQSAARQDEVLGPTRGALLRRGAYKLPNFYDNRGRLLTITELRARDALTFEELGL